MNQDKRRALCRCCKSKLYKRNMYLLGDGWRCKPCLDKTQAFMRLHEARP